MANATMFRFVPMLMLLSSTAGFAFPKISMSTEIPCDRRDVIRSTFVASALLQLGSNPCSAAYIDPTTDPPRVTNRVYLDVQIGDKNPGRLVIGLFGDLMPRVSENFAALCEGNSYAGTTFYRVLSDYTLQGGAIGDPTGRTGRSSYGEPFEPDNYRLMHSKAGLVSMVRDASGGVDSRFFINCNDDGGWADDRYAAFGIVEDGMDLVAKIEKVEVTRPKNTPKVPVNILASGVVEDGSG